MSARFCPRCGHPTDPNGAFCVTCGAPLPRASPPPQVAPSPAPQSFPGYTMGWTPPPGGPTRLVSRGKKGASIGTTVGLGLIIIGLALIGIGYVWVAIDEQSYYAACGSSVTNPNVDNCSHLASAEQNATWEADLMLGTGVFITGGGFVLYFTYLPRRVESALSDVEWELGP